MSLELEQRLMRARAALRAAAQKAEAGDRLEATRAEWIRSQIVQMEALKSNPLMPPLATPSPEEREAKLAAVKARNEAKLKALSTASSLTIPNSLTEKNLEGSAQVTVMCDESSHMTDVVEPAAPQLAGTSPHAPHSKGKKKNYNHREGSKIEDLHIRLTKEMKQELVARATKVGSYPSSYASEIIANDLGMPADEFALARKQEVLVSFAKLTYEINKVGINFNQIAAATNAGKPCPLKTLEINRLLSDWSRLCADIGRLQP